MKRDGKSDREREKRQGEQVELARPENLCSCLKSDPSRAGYKELTPSVASLADDMIEDSDPGAEHTQAKTSNQHTAAGLYLDYSRQTGEYCFFTVGPYVDRMCFIVGIETSLRCRDEE